MITDNYLLWPTPLMVRRFNKPAEFNSALVEAVKPRELTSGDRFHRGGWYGNIFAELASVSEINELRLMFERAVLDYIDLHLDTRYLGRKLYMRAWANRYENGQHIVGHHHGAQHLTATYYAQIGKPANGDPLEGRIVFLDPRGGHMLTQKGIGPRFSILPEPGMMIVMPGFLTHETGPYFSSPARIAISADISIQPADMQHFNRPLTIERAGGDTLPKHPTHRAY